MFVFVHPCFFVFVHGADEYPPLPPQIPAPTLCICRVYQGAEKPVQDENGEEEEQEKEEGEVGQATLGNNERVQLVFYLFPSYCPPFYLYTYAKRQRQQWVRVCQVAVNDVNDVNGWIMGRVTGMTICMCCTAVPRHRAQDTFDPTNTRRFSRFILQTLHGSEARAP